MLVTVTAVGGDVEGLERAVYAVSREMGGVVERFPDVSSPLGNLIDTFEDGGIRQLLYAAHRLEVFGRGPLNKVTLVVGGLLEHLLEGHDLDVNGVLGPSEKVPDVFVVVVACSERPSVWRKVLSALEVTYDFRVCVVCYEPGLSWVELSGRIVSALKE
jgi:hypothetical protein